MYIYMYMYGERERESKYTIVTLGVYANILYKLVYMPLSMYTNIDHYDIYNIYNFK